MNARMFIALLSASLLFFPPMSAFGQLSVPVDVNIDATIGLDEPTRALIGNLPKAMHDQLIASLQDALPILQKNVDEYLAKVNDILDHQINHMQCAITGIAAEADRRWKLPLTRRKGPLELFDAYEKDELGRLRESSTADFYVKVYGDTFYEASVTYCEMEFSGSAIDAQPAENRNRELNRLWLRVSATCSTASDCVKKQREVTQNLIDSSDKRDVQSFHASERLATVPQPVDPGFFTSFDSKPYEKSINQLLSIQDEIRLARIRRAAELISSLPAKLSIVDSEIARANTALQPTSSFGCLHTISAGQVQSAKPHGDTAENLWQESDKAISEAQMADQKNLEVAIKNIRTQLDSERNQIDAINNAKPRTWTEPDPCKLTVSHGQ
jgi:hypothetical protein